MLFIIVTEKMYEHVVIHAVVLKKNSNQENQNQTDLNILNQNQFQTTTQCTLPWVPEALGRPLIPRVNVHVLMSKFAL